MIVSDVAPKKERISTISEIKNNISASYLQ